MINNLHVRNLALIDEADISFGPGLNILTGETGAGKSIIIDSLGLALGDRADSDAIRSGSEFGLVELSITPDSNDVWNYLSELGIPHEEEILIKRRIYPGRSDCRVNGETVTLKELTKITSMLIDICGQRESLTLLRESSLKNMLDACGGEKVAELLNQIRELYTEYSSVLQKINDSDEDDTLRKRKADLAEFELNEIDNAALSVDEDIELENAHRQLTHFSKITESLSTILNLCDGDGGASSLISHSLREIRNVSDLDSQLSDIESQLQDIDSLALDMTREIRNYLDNLEYDPEYFNQIVSRLDLINHLKDKYGSTVEQILKYRDEKAEELEKLSDFDSYMAKLTAEKEMLHEKLLNLCNQLHELRQSSAHELEKNLVCALSDMNFIGCELEITVTPDESHITSTGFDKIDFLISMNPGEPMKQLSSVASGGELSRIMLAIKCITGNRDNIDTQVFDEIDTGISGITSWKVGEKLSSLSGKAQVLCITHQAQVAAQADNHYLIEKNVIDGRTLTSINSLSRDEMIVELARMMGSDESSAGALSAAEELKNKAGK